MHIIGDNMAEILNFIFDNFFFFVFLLLCYYLYKQYKDLKERTIKINEIFEKTLNKYLEDKIKIAEDTTDRILKEYGREDTVSTEINRLLLLIEKGVKGSINDKVFTSNAINKFKLSKKIDFERYPYLLELNNLGTFREEDLTNELSEIALARKTYNAEAFRYNEKASSIIMQYMTKLLKLPSQYNIFDAQKVNRYEDNYEVFEEEEPEINSLSTLNRSENVEVEKSLNDLLLNDKEEREEVTIEHSDLILKPSTNLEDKEKKD